MKKTLVILLACALLLPLGTGYGIASAPETFTLLVYLCGSDLESDAGYATDDILEMVSAGVTADGPVTVLVETGGTETWWIEGIDPEQNQRFLIGDDDITLVDHMPHRNMGDPYTLADFVAFGVSNYPADRYGLVLWNHGMGSAGGICYDEITDDYLSNADIHDALGSAVSMAGEIRFDFLLLDACLMATFELASSAADFVDYMIASQELSPATGIDYEHLLSLLAEEPAIETEVLGRAICDQYMRTGLENDPDDYMTISLLDLSKVATLTDMLEDMAGGLQQALRSTGFSGISRTRQTMRSLGDYGDASSDMVDMRQFVEAYAGISGTDAVQAIRAIDDVVAYNRYTQDSLGNLCGIAILAPLKTRDAFDGYIETYDALDRYPKYTAFLTDYTSQLGSGSYSFGRAIPRETSGEDMLDSLGENIFFSGQGFAQAIERIDADAYEAGEEYAAGEASTEEDIYAYELSLSAEDMEYLAFVEGNLMIDVSDEDIEAYVDLGYLQNAVIDWDNSTVYSLFDGTWPALDGQPVHMTDQIVTPNTRRSLIDVTVNGEEVYLIAIFDEKRPDGEIIGYSAGYTESGLPERSYSKLNAGDVIIPNYYLYTYEDGEEQIDRFQGAEVIFDGTPLDFGYMDITGDNTAYAYTFCLNDIFGEYQFSDFLYFTL